MNNSEIVEEFKKDIRDINLKNENWLKDFRRAVLKSSKFPCLRVYKVKTSNNNTLFVQYLAFERSKHSSPNIGVYSVYDCNGGKRVIVRSPARNNRILPNYVCDRYFQDGDYTIFTNHFFDRYQERILKDDEMSKMDVISHCMANNWAQFSLEINDEVEAVYHCFDGHYEKGTTRINYVSACNFGYNFGVLEKNVSVVVTTITEDMLKPNQKKLFPSIKIMLQEVCKKVYGDKSINL